MMIVSVISFCITGLLFLEVVLRKADFFSPARIYIFFHSVALGVAFLALHRAMTPFHPLTSLVYFGSGACYLMGTASAHLLDKGRVRSSARPLNEMPYNWKLHLGFSFAGFLFFVWGVNAAHQATGTFPLFAKNQVKTLKTFAEVSWRADIAITLGTMIAVLFFISTLRPRRAPVFRDIGFWMIIVTISIFSLVASRSGMIFFGFFSLVFFQQGVRRISILKMSGFFIFFLTVFLWTGYLKVSQYGKEHDFNLSSSKTIPFIMKIPYIYVANNFWNLDYALNPENFQERHPTTYGYTTFSGLLDMLTLPGGNIGMDIKESARFDDQFQKRATKVRGLNTIGYQWGLYKDFGIAGVLILPFAFGLVFGTFYRMVRRQPTILNLTLYSYLAFLVALSWFLAMWEAVMFCYGFSFMILTCYFSTVVPASGKALLKDRNFAVPV